MTFLDDFFKIFILDFNISFPDFNLILDPFISIIKNILNDDLSQNK